MLVGTELIIEYIANLACLTGAYECKLLLVTA